MILGLTIKDVSKSAGVSIASVSRYINKTGNVSPQTAKKIEHAIEELKFRPNIIGRSLRTGKSKLIGVMLPSLSNPVFSDAMTGIQQLAREYGYTILITNTEYDSSYEESAIEALLSNGVDGLILTVSCEQDSLLLKKLDKEKVPYVLLYNNTLNPNRSIVSIDNAKASEDVAKAFLNLGHRRFGMISISQNLSDRAILRQQAFVNYLNKKGFNKIELIEIDSTEANIEEELKSIYSKANPPTALFCSNDAIALNVISLLKRINIQVPNNVSVIGFDGIKIGELIDPTLSTVVQPSLDMGKEAFKQLLSLIIDNSNPQTILLPYKLKMAGTTSNPPKNQ